MAKSTGPALAIGGVTLFNQVVLNGEGFNWRIPIASGFVALALAGVEHLSEPLAVGLAWLGLVTVIFTRVDPKVPAPAESLVTLTKGTR
jgi:hypothetical protein